MDNEDERKVRILTREGVAKLLGISIASVDRYVRDGLIPFKKIKGRILFNERDVRRFLFNDAALPKAAKEQLDFILKAKVKQVDEYRRTAKRYLGLRKILSLMDKLERLDKDDSPESRETREQVKFKLEVLMDEDRKAEKEEREKMKETLRGMKKEFE